MGRDEKAWRRDEESERAWDVLQDIHESAVNRAHGEGYDAGVRDALRTIRAEVADKSYCRAVRSLLTRIGKLYGLGR